MHIRARGVSRAISLKATCVAYQSTASAERSASCQWSFADTGRSSAGKPSLAGSDALGAGENAEIPLILDRLCPAVKLVSELSSAKATIILFQPSGMAGDLTELSQLSLCCSGFRTLIPGTPALVAGWCATCMSLYVPLGGRRRDGTWHFASHERGPCFGGCSGQTPGWFPASWRLACTMRRRADFEFSLATRRCGMIWRGSSSPELSLSAAFMDAWHGRVSFPRLSGKQGRLSTK